MFLSAELLKLGKGKSKIAAKSVSGSTRFLFIVVEMVYAWPA